jgi:DNA-directed RNA polymerase III subunit RPC1
VERIRLLKLEVSADTIRYSICTSKLKIKPNNCVLVGESIIKVKQNPSEKKHQVFRIHRFSEYGSPDPGRLLNPDRDLG